MARDHRQNRGVMMQIRQWVLRHRFLAFLITVIGLAVVMVLISMDIYYKSGAFQLDLSRPEYKPVRSQISSDTKTEDTFASQGEITNEVLDDFLTRYKTEASRASDAQAFQNDVLSDEQLGM